MQTKTFAVRLRSRGPGYRAGLKLGPIGEWGVHVLELVVADALQRLLALVLDPKIDVEVGTPKGDDDFDWKPALSEDEIRSVIATLPENTEGAAEGTPQGGPQGGLTPVTQNADAGPTPNPSQQGADAGQGQSQPAKAAAAAPVAPKPKAQNPTAAKPKPDKAQAKPQA